MADATPIEWTDATWNIVTGCSVVSPGCTNCYAMRLAGTRLRNHPSRQGLTVESKAGPVWNGQVRFNAQWLDQPLRWTRPRKIFVAAHGDLFHEGVTDAQLDQIFAVMALCPQHVFQILTKRPERMRAWFAGIETETIDRGENPRIAPSRFDRAACDVARTACAGGRLEDTPWPLPNVWLGVSAEDQKRADERVFHLRHTPAAVRWVSAEPLLGPIDFTRLDNVGTVATDGLRGVRVQPRDGMIVPGDEPLGRIDWIVAGGESGPGARPMHPDWVRAIRDQCAAAETPFLFKQWGEHLPDEQEDAGKVVWDAGTDCPRVHRFADGVAAIRIGKALAGRRLDGVVYDTYPEPDHV